MTASTGASWGPGNRAVSWRHDRAAGATAAEYVRATESIACIIELVEKMLASGAAYVVDDPEYPDVYFRVDATEQFGYESGYDIETMSRLFAERGG